MSKSYGPQKTPPKAAPRIRKFGPNSIPPGRHPGRRGLYGQPESAPGYSGMKKLPNSGTRK